jgi:hypothetical protein
MHSIIRDERGRLVPVVRPKRWLAASVKRSRDRSDRIMHARKQRKAKLTTTAWVGELDRRGICELEATGIAWGSVEHWLDALDPRDTFVARLVVKQVLQTLADDKARPTERFEARRELYRRLIAAGIVD